METEKKKNKKQSAIVFYPSPGRTHLNPVVELSKLILKDYPSISVTIVTSSLPPDSPALHSYASNVSDQHSINFIHLEAPPGGLVTTDSAACDPARAAREFVASMFEIPMLNNSALRRTLLELSHWYNIRAFIMDYFCHFASPVSAALKLPTYYLRTVGAFSADILLYLPSIDKSISKSLQDLDPDLLVHFPGIPPIRCKDMPVFHTDRSHRVYQYFLDGSTQLVKSNGIILNTFNAFDMKTLDTIMEGKCTPGEPNVPPIYCVGPLITTYHHAYGASTKGDDHADPYLTWLDTQPSRSVLFLCFGRWGKFSLRQLKEIAVGLERSGVRFMWVVRNPPDDEMAGLEALLPRGFLERTKERGLVVKKWAPQFQILKHGSVGGFVTHCGWSSVMEAVCAGVPMLAWPLYAEQKLNKLYLVDLLKMALGLRQEDHIHGWVSADELEEKVTELMSSEMGKEMREKAVHMKQYALEALMDGGSSRVAISKLMHNLDIDVDKETMIHSFI